MFGWRELSYIVLGTVLVLGVVQCFVLRPLLPERVASHFDFNGKPNGGMNRDTFVVTMLATNLGLPVFMVLLSWITRILPNSLINVPHKEYWLTPERRRTTLQWFEQWMVWISSATGLFLIAMFWLVYLANRDGGGLNNVAFFTIMSLYLLVIFAATAFAYVRFQVPSGAAIDDQ